MAKKTITRITPSSLAKIASVLYAVAGIVAGLFVSVLASLGLSEYGDSTGVLSVAFGLGAFIFLPLFYAALGAVIGFVSALVYNFVAARVGGLELELK